MKTTYFFLFLILSVSAFAQPFDDDPARDERIKSIINKSAVSKCPDGSAKEKLDMGKINITIDAAYIAKTNNQDFVTITPRPSGNFVELYYCAPKRIIWENGKQRTESIPVDTFRYDLGYLSKRENCDFSDIRSGVIQLRFKGLAYPAILNVRPIINTQAEETEYKKLCSEKIRSKSSKVPDGKVSVQ